MATQWGNAGLVKIGTNTVSEVLRFEFTETVTPIDDTSMGDTYKSHIAGSGIKSWSGSMTCHWDKSDTAQTALTVGASVTLKLYPEGTTTGNTYFQGTATLTSRGQTVEMDGSTIQCTFQFEGSGALTKSTA